MSCPTPIHCRQCNEPLDVYVPFEDQFCSEECFEEYNEETTEAEPQMNGVAVLSNPFAWSR